MGSFVKSLQKMLKWKGDRWFRLVGIVVGIFSTYALVAIIVFTSVNEGVGRRLMGGINIFVIMFLVATIFFAVKCISLPSP